MYLRAGLLIAAARLYSDTSLPPPPPDQVLLFVALCVRVFMRVSARCEARFGGKIFQFIGRRMFRTNGCVKEEFDVASISVSEREQDSSNKIICEYSVYNDIAFVL